MLIQQIKKEVSELPKVQLKEFRSWFEEFETVTELIAGLKEYFEFYNFERPHQSFSGKTPAEVYWREEVFKMAA